MNLRNSLLAGLGLCVLVLTTLAFVNMDFRHVLLTNPAIPAIMTLVLLWNGYAAIRWTRDSMVLQDGVRWGLAIGCGWVLVAVVPVSNELAGPLWFFGLFTAILLPFASGAAIAIRTGNAWIGRRVGFWGGVIGGLMGFLVLAIREFVRGDEFALVAAFWAMFLFGSLYGGIAGTVGGWIGLKLYRTGEPPLSQRERVVRSTG
jgi:hypothetical protein